MGNYAYIHSKYKLTNEKLLPMMQEINRRYFKNQLTITPPASIHDVWEISITKYYQSLQMWIESPRILIINHKMGTLMWWIDEIIEHNLTYNLNGYITDDGLGKEEKIYPQPEMYSTYLEFLYKIYHGYPGYIFKKLAVFFELRSAKRLLPRSIYNKICKGEE